MKFFRKMVLYFLGTASSAFVSFIFLPVFTSKFSVQDYGNYDLTYSIISMLLSVFFMEVWVSILRFLKDKKFEKDKIFQHAFLITLILVIPYSIAHLVLSKFLSLPSAWIYIFFGISLLMQNMYQFYLRGIDNSKLYVVSGITITVIQSILTLIFIFATNYGVLSIIYAQIMSRIIVLTIIELKYKLVTRVSFKEINKKLIKEILFFSIPFSINALAFWGMTNVNRIFASIYLDDMANGYIAVASKFVFLLSLITSTFILVWQEYSFAEANSCNRFKKYNDVLNSLLIISSICLSILVPITYMIFPIMVDTNYHNSLLLIPIYYIATFFSVFNGYFGQIFSAEKKTAQLTYSTFAGAIGNLVTLYVFTKTIGLFGIPLSLAIGTLLNILVRYLMLRKYIRFSIKLKTLSLSLLISMSVLMYYIDFNFIYKISCTIVLLMIYLLLEKGNIKKIFLNMFKYKRT